MSTFRELMKSEPNLMIRDPSIQSYFADMHKRFGERFVTKSGVSDTEAAEFPVADPQTVNVFSAIDQKTVFGAMPVIDVPFYVPLTGLTGGTADWVGGNKSVRVSKPTFSTAVWLKRRKVAGVAAVSNELLAVSGGRMTNLFETLLRRRAALVFDEAVLSFDPETDSTPAGILNGAATIAATSDPQVDFAEQIEHFDGDPSRAYYVSDPWTWTRVAMSRDTSGGFMFPNIGPRGGSLLGIPAISTRGSAVDTSGGLITLVDPSAIAYASDGGSFVASQEVFLEQDNSPTGASDTPTAATATFISAFQDELTAIKIVFNADWAVMRSGAVSVITGAKY